MTENRFDLVCAEIKRLRKEVKDNIVELGNSESERIGLFNDLEIYDNILSFIDSMKKESASEDFEKEVEKMWAQESKCRDTDYTIAELTKQDYEDCARHFANWQKQKMMKGAIDGKIYETQARSKRKATTTGFVSHLDYKVGDKVKIIIAKE